MNNLDALSSVKNELEAAKRELLDATARVETAVHSLAVVTEQLALEDERPPKVGRYTSIHNYKCPICGEHDNLDELGHTDEVYSLGCPTCKIWFSVASYDPEIGGSI